MPVSRMELADFGSPEKIVQAILAQVPELPIPVPIEELARDLDILEITVLETQGFEGGLLTDEERSAGIVLVNEASSRPRRRFTIGHELGHFPSPWHKPARPGEFLCTPDDMRRVSVKPADRTAQMEVEANRFAALLLLPQPHFRRDLNRHRGADIDHILALADRYDVSKEATVRRYIELQDEPCAAVLSQHGKVLRVYRGKAFPYVELSAGHFLPDRSLTARAILPEGKTSDWQEGDAAHWLSSGRGQRLPTLYEQVHVQRSGYRLTLLTIDQEAYEDEEEREALAESYQARFRR